ncbi:hypothetical protein DI272_17960 [Streptomyces sp. Act143]|uniref:hypothetical protein n=1 Tax=Streptomyces sp. Act143 TaxID=2200760 RepID=UPI000D678F3F|nr:hypothetical protein [Streptomyces sp. Act143]PWI15844.1 hypothetical protein DI272_17960 [Streptomyces sp. Act143]
MGRFTKLSGWCAGALLVAGSTVVGGAGAAQAATVQRAVKVCSFGNYTSYAKVVGGGLNTQLQRVPAGSCWTTTYLSNGQPADIYLFGLYNISHKGFEVGVCHSVTNSLVNFGAAGQTTAPEFAVSFGGDGPSSWCTPGPGVS